MIRKMVGGIQKAAINISGDVGAKMTKIGMKMQGATDEVVEAAMGAAGNNVGSKLNSVDKAVAASEKADKAYKTMKKQVHKGPVKEAQAASDSDTISNAIKYKTQAQEATTFTYGGQQYTKMNDGTYHTRANAKEKSTPIDQARYDEMHAKYVDEQTEFGRQKDIDAAFNTATTPHLDWTGFKNWANDNQIIVAGALAGGALLLTDD